MAAGAMPQPSSSTDRRASRPPPGASAVAKRTQLRDAPAWRTTLVTASRAMENSATSM